MKHCKRCDTAKPLEAFSKNCRKKDGLQIYCKQCYTAINADTYLRLPKRREKIAERNKDMVAYLRELVMRYKRVCGCRLCGEKEPVALDLHHLDPSVKEEGVARLVGNKSLRRIREEIKKCVVLCSNCHRKHHAGIEGYGIVV